METTEYQSKSKAPEAVRNSTFGCNVCLQAGIECHNGSKYEPRKTGPRIGKHPSCKAYIYCD